MSDPALNSIAASEAAQTQIDAKQAQALGAAMPGALQAGEKAANAAAALAGIAGSVASAAPQVAAVEAGVQVAQIGAQAAEALIGAENTPTMQAGRMDEEENAAVKQADADLKAAQAGDPEALKKLSEETSG